MLTILKKASIDAALAAVSSKTNLTVWVDLGTSYRSLATWDLEHNRSLVVIAVEALATNLANPQQPSSPRYVKVNGACSSRPVKSATFYAHRSPTCGTLFPTRLAAPTLGDGCTGDVPHEVSVDVFHLSQLLKRLRLLLPHGQRIELLKMDLQGAELDCLKGAGEELANVDNILLEV